jgi:hypothetical protein
MAVTGLCRQHWHLGAQHPIDARSTDPQPAGDFREPDAFRLEPGDLSSPCRRAVGAWMIVPRWPAMSETRIRSMYLLRDINADLCARRHSIDAAQPAFLMCDDHNRRRGVWLTTYGFQPR